MLTNAAVLQNMLVSAGRIRSQKGVMLPCRLALWVAIVLLLEDGVCRVVGGSFEFQNLCSYTVWIGYQADGGQPVLQLNNVVLNPGGSTTASTPSGWSGRFWGRTGCQFDATSAGTCSTGDCGGTLLCTGMGGSPPATLAEFTLNGANGKDYYDVSLVDGYNIPISVAPTSTSTVGTSSGVSLTDTNSSSSTPSCGVAGCQGDLNESCPSELQVKGTSGQVIACKSACETFGTPQYCCTGSYSSPATCPSTSLSQIFKAACPRAYSYAYDDSSSIYTCTGSSYAITFCPPGSVTPSGASRQSPPASSTSNSSPTTSNASPIIPNQQQQQTSNDYPELEPFPSSSEMLNPWNAFNMPQLVLTLSFALLVLEVHKYTIISNIFEPNTNWVLVPTSCGAGIDVSYLNLGNTCEKQSLETHGMPSHDRHPFVTNSKLLGIIKFSILCV